VSCEAEPWRAISSCRLILKFCYLICRLIQSYYGRLFFLLKQILMIIVWRLVTVFSRPKFKIVNDQLLISVQYLDQLLVLDRLVSFD